MVEQITKFLFISYISLPFGMLNVILSPLINYILIGSSSKSLAVHHSNIVYEQSVALRLAWFDVNVFLVQHAFCHATSGSLQKTESKV